MSQNTTSTVRLAGMALTISSRVLICWRELRGPLARSRVASARGPLPRSRVDDTPRSFATQPRVDDTPRTRPALLYRRQFCISARASDGARTESPTPCQSNLRRHQREGRKRDDAVPTQGKYVLELFNPDRRRNGSNRSSSCPLVCHLHSVVFNRFNVRTTAYLLGNLELAILCARTRFLAVRPSELFVQSLNQHHLVVGRRLIYYFIFFHLFFSFLFCFFYAIYILFCSMKMHCGIRLHG